MIDKTAIGQRIVEARKAKGIHSQEALAKALNDASKKSRSNGTITTLTRQTIQNWEKGKVCPPWDKVELLALVFGDPYSEEWIMFGDKREQQLAAERPVLVYCTNEEAMLLNDFRHANSIGKKSIKSHARAIREEFPAEAAGVHLMRALDGKSK